MPGHLLRDIEMLMNHLMEVSKLVETSIKRSIKSLIERNAELAGDVIKGDTTINEEEVRIEEECLKILALHQPVAADLRFIICTMKVNNELERMGDLAVNIAERAVYLAEHDRLKVDLDFTRMTNVVRKMMRECLYALINKDAELAEEVLATDDEADALNREMFVKLQELMIQDSSSVKRAVCYLSASRNLERIADLATNIAEDVIFMVEGGLVRHGYRQSN